MARSRAGIAMMRAGVGVLLGPDRGPARKVTSDRNTTRCYGRERCRACRAAIDAVVGMVNDDLMGGGGPGTSDGEEDEDEDELMDN
jgi:hypothetical protein